MTEIHEDNDTPTASDDDVKRMDADTIQNADAGKSVADQGSGVEPLDATDTDVVDDPKSGGTPVHSAPTPESPRS